MSLEAKEKKAADMTLVLTKWQLRDWNITTNCFNYKFKQTNVCVVRLAKALH